MLIKKVLLTKKVQRKILQIVLTTVTAVTISACGGTIPLTRQEAFSTTLTNIQQENILAQTDFKDGEYPSAIKHWYRVINQADHFNRDYPSQQGLTLSFLNDKTAAYCSIGEAHSEMADANDGNLNMYKDALQSYLLCLQYQPENIRAYNDAIKVANKLNDIARSTKLQEWRDATVRIQDEYRNRARKIDASYPQRRPGNQSRNRAFLQLYEWAFNAASDAGVAVLADRYRMSVENYKRLTAK